MNFEPNGLIPAMVTPLKGNSEIKEDGLRQLTNYLIDAGVHGLFPTGSQGEFFALGLEEKKQIWKIVAKESAGRVPIYAGTGSITTRETVKLAQTAEEVGVDAISVITPFFVTPSQKELYEHYLKVAETVSLPVVLYSNPPRTKVKLEPSLVANLSQIDNIVGIKDSSGDMSLSVEYITRTEENFAVMAGQDTLIYPTLSYGGNGAVSATANVAPKLATCIYEAFSNGNHRKAMRAQKRLASIRATFKLGTFPVVVKEALDMIGIEVGPARSPVKPLDRKSKEKLTKVLYELELLNK